MIYFALVLAFATFALCDQRIVGGNDVTSTSFAPWQASLQVGGSHYCGGSLISATKVISTCHCKQSSLNVVLGTTHYMYPGQTFKTTDFFCHPSYNSASDDYDYAIITISGAGFNSAVQPITVASKEYPARTQALMTGWGVTRGNIMSYNLQYAYTYLISEIECKSVWGDLVTDRMQCANDDLNSACNGDFGGPLAVKDGDNWVLVGNASWGTSECFKTIPSVWSKNSAVYSWIKTFI